MPRKNDSKRSHEDNELLKRQRLAEAINAVSEAFDADIYFYSGEIDDAGFGKLTASVARNKNKNNVLLILVTGGGYANSGYQIARMLQKVYDQFIIFTPSYCKSAGTIIALGAHRIIMDSFSELGPLDVQLTKENEITGRRSGLLSRSKFEALQEASFELFEHCMLRIVLASEGVINFKVASDLSASMTANLLSSVYAQINPDTVGGDYRDLLVAFQYGTRLAAISGNASVAAVKHLVEDYPAHDFIIDNEEASDLFENVEEPTDGLYRLIEFLGNTAYIEQSPSVVLALSRDEVGKGEDDDNGRHTAENDTAMAEDRGDDRPSTGATPVEKRDDDSADGSTPTEAPIRSPTGRRVEGKPKGPS